MSWASKLSDPYRIDHGRKFRLKDFDPADTGHFHSKEHVQELLDKGIAEMRELHGKLYAQSEWAVLIILQGIDAAGKDGLIKHVMSGLNPQGCEVHSFKQPSLEELNHDFMWRANRRLPERGHIGIFNRSYYEEVLVVRVHPELLKNEALAERVQKDEDFWTERYESIVNMEQHLHRNNTRIAKVFLHVSREEQRRRFLSRIDDEHKNWKFNMGDLHERKYWKRYQQAYEECVRATSTDRAPWYVVPADDKENARLIVSQILLDTLSGLKMQLPRVTEERRKELQHIREALEGKTPENAEA